MKRARLSSLVSSLKTRLPLANVIATERRGAEGRSGGCLMGAAAERRGGVRSRSGGAEEGL